MRGREHPGHQLDDARNLAVAHRGSTPERAQGGGAADAPETREWRASAAPTPHRAQPLSVALDSQHPLLHVLLTALDERGQTRLASCTLRLHGAARALAVELVRVPGAGGSRSEKPVNSVCIASGGVGSNTPSIATVVGIGST